MDNNQSRTMILKIFGWITKTTTALIFIGIVGLLYLRYGNLNLNYTFTISGSYEEITKRIPQVILTSTRAVTFLIAYGLLGLPPIFLLFLRLKNKKTIDYVNILLLLVLTALILFAGYEVYRVNREIKSFKSLLDGVKYPGITSYEFSVDEQVILGGYNDRIIRFTANEEIHPVFNYYKKNLALATDRILLNPEKEVTDWRAQLRVASIRSSPKKFYYRIDFSSEKDSLETKVSITSDPSVISF